MACRSCQRNLLRELTSRQGLVASQSQVQSTAITRQLGRQIIIAASQQQQQRRGFRSTAQSQESLLKKIGNQLLKSTSQPYQVHAATETIYKACAAEAAYTISETDKRDGTVKKTEEGEEIGTGSTTWHTDFDLQPTFSTWSQITMLNLYLVYARLRNQPVDAARSWQKQLTDHFFFDAEERMDLVHGITSRGLRHRYLKDLFIQWRGVIAAYDEGVTKGDAVLATAVWRNVYKAREDVDVRNLAAITSWMRACLKSLDATSDESLFFATSRLLKIPPKNEFRMVDLPTRELEGILPAQSQAVISEEAPRIVKEAV